MPISQGPNACHRCSLVLIPSGHCIHLPAPLRSHVAFSTPAAPLSPSPTLCASTALLTLTRNCLAGTVSGIWVLWDAGATSCRPCPSWGVTTTSITNAALPDVH
eukprot:GGOE01008529.1.p6 GENE.GGOE01008529.1~~GGOE01008529.1.p6  ORF type:complete len:104 (-),score=0.58 GGOE01008529.1:553-864(-)